MMQAGVCLRRDTETTLPELTEQHRIRLKEEEHSGLESVRMAETECAAPGLNTLEPECVTAHSGVNDVHHTHTSLIKTETDLGSTHTGDIKTENLDSAELAYVTHLHPDQIKTETEDGGYLKAEHISDLHDIKCVDIKSDQMKCESSENLVSDVMNTVMNGDGVDHKDQTEPGQCAGEPNPNCNKAEMHDLQPQGGDLNQHCDINNENNQTTIVQKSTSSSNKHINCRRVNAIIEPRMNNSSKYQSILFQTQSIRRNKGEIHAAKKPYKCTQCDKCFATKSNLNKHVRNHPGEKAYKFIQCGTCFGANSYLDTHHRVNTGERPFNCAHCGKCLITKFPPAAAKMENVISNLKKFSKLDFQSKQEVINNGRPMPELKDLLQTKGQKVTRSFQMDWYQRKDWLCGCATNNRLYCFPCLLFSNINNVWTNLGFCDLKHLSSSLHKHEKSTTHIHSQIALKTFGTSRIDLALNEQRRLSVSVHNAMVKENHEILKDLINATCFLAKQELPFCGNDESASSSNRGNYVELVNAFAERDQKLSRHLETASVFSGLSDRIQSDLIEAVAEVIRNDIKEEINAAPFVAVEVDETAEVTNETQVSVVLRYVAKREGACEVREAFLGFEDVNDDKGAPAIADYVLGVLGKYNCVEKLVALTYDRASAMATDLNGVQAKIKEKVPEATFTHCYAHKLNRVLSHSARCMPECKTFFKIVEGLATFFNKSTKRTDLLDDVVKRRLPKTAPTRWSSDSRLVQTIGMYQSDLRAVFRIMSENPDGWDSDTLVMATGYDLWLSKASTCFFIMAYEGIFSETDALFRVLRNKVMDIGFCCARIRDTMGAVERQRGEFDSFYDRFEQKCVTLGLTDDARSKQPIRDVRRIMFYNILDDVGVQMKARFDHLSELTFLGLVDCTKFYEMSQHFDDIKLPSLSKYARYFDFVRLKADLIGLYSSQMVRNECKSPTQLLTFLAQNDLMPTVPEATKLLQLVLTITATTASVDGSFSALKRLNTYSRNRTDQGRLSSLAIISIEKERLSKLKENKEDFCNKVTDIFVQKDRRMDFIYK